MNQDEITVESHRYFTRVRRGGKIIGRLDLLTNGNATVYLGELGNRTKHHDIPRLVAEEMLASFVACQTLSQ